MPTNKEIFDYWIDAELIEKDKLINEKCCFACQDDAYRLEKAHIVAASIGGPNIPSNLVLLCKRCHIEAPMLSVKEPMIDWMNDRQSYMSYAISQLEGFFNYVKYNKIEIPKDFKELLVARLKELKADSHPLGNSMSTVICAAIEIMKDLKEGYILIL